ncbi:MAG: glycosyltransferase family 2 protein [Clostridia bacterium]|nr:glycosyltransferase family 2 protein [Clostridia bacterium]
MNYLEIVNLVFFILTTLMGLLTVHFAVFFIVGLFAKKKFPHTEDKRRYGIVVSARNEEAVIGNLIESVRKCKYPQDKLQVFVVAHNCTDNTAQVARDSGAIVYEYNNENEKMKGYALKYLFDKIKQDYGIESNDGYFVIDADNVLPEDYIDKMNDAFVANNCEKVITSFRNAKNFGQNILSALYGIYFAQGCRFESRGRTLLGCSTRISGTGFLFSSNVVKDGWKYVTITEDWEFTADQIIENNKIVYCDEAEFYDEQPTGMKIMFRQRLRWAKGHLLVCVTRFKDLMKGLFKPKSKGGSQHKFSIYDITVNILPSPVMFTLIVVLKPVCLAFAPLFGFDAVSIWTDWAIQLGYGAATYYGVTVFTAIILLIVEHKRIKHVNFGLKILAVFLWPIFLALASPLEFVSMFVKNLKWKAIPHKDARGIDNIHCRKSKN